MMELRMLRPESWMKNRQTLIPSQQPEEFEDYWQMDLLTICWIRFISLHLSALPWKSAWQQIADEQHQVKRDANR